MSKPSAAAPPGTTSREFAVLVPVKPPTHGKSRLTTLPEDQRRELARAFALDTVSAALRTPGVGHVLAVTDDFRFAGELAGLGCTVIPDGTSDDLNATLVQACAEAARRWPGVAPVALLADLPCLLPGDLAEVLARLDPDRATFVRDLAGTGTTLYAAPAGSFDPQFGPGSAQAHLDAGAREVTAVATSVRRDVDDLADLTAALVQGVGPYTAAATGRA
jgi:2-phospho-L-lactate guanylyltransferase